MLSRSYVCGRATVASWQNSANFAAVFHTKKVSKLGMA